jgi:hypothetical protein
MDAFVSTQAKPSGKKFGPEGARDVGWKPANPDPYAQSNWLGARDADPAITDLPAGFDPARLAGTAPPIDASAAEIPDAIVNTFPLHLNCASLAGAPEETECPSQ